MTPTLSGRMQTRMFLIAVVGSLWTLLVGPLLPRAGIPSLGALYQGAFSVLAVVLAAGLLWELVYHALQQLRWEKDWPALFALLTGLNEGLVAWMIIRALVEPPIPGATFVVHFSTTWLVTFLVVTGPMRVLSVRWRFMGGRLV